MQRLKDLALTSGSYQIVSQNCAPPYSVYIQDTGCDTSIDLPFLFTSKVHTLTEVHFHSAYMKDMGCVITGLHILFTAIIQVREKLLTPF